MPNAPAFYSVDPYAYRRRIGDLMSRPPVVVKADTPARRAVEIMVERRISSVLVSEDGSDGGPISQYGIVTERDIMRRLASERGEFLGRPVDSFASRPLASVSASAFAYRAISRMDRLQIRHLAVRSDEGMLAGIVSARDLLKLRASAAINLDDAIEHSESAAEMAAAWAALPGVARALLAEGIEARTVAEIVSEEACAMTRRAAVLAERTMEAAGRGGPPCAYAMLVLGSAGRGESLLAADQDNAIVFAEGDPDGEEDRWFAEFGETLNATLDAAGIPYCSGGVMAKNAGFRGSFATWQARIEDWVRRSRPEDLLNVDITFDLRPVHGELAMAGRLFDLAYERGRDEPAFAKLLGARLTEGNPFTIFGRFALDRGRLDLKLHGLFPIVAAARALAIRHGIAKRSTRERLDALIAMDLGGDMDMQAMLASQETLLGLLLAQQIRDLYAGTPLSNRVEIAALSPLQQAELKTILKQLQTVPTLVHDLMFA
jgi:DNA polymerase-3 subunit epsilon/CBS domain-containing protein